MFLYGCNVIWNKLVHIMNIKNHTCHIQECLVCRQLCMFLLWLFWLPDGNFELLLGIKQESGQFFIWLIEANQQNLLHVWYLVTQRVTDLTVLFSSDSSLHFSYFVHNCSRSTDSPSHMLQCDAVAWELQLLETRVWELQMIVAWTLCLGKINQ